jgi:hypothetical protein
MLRRFLVFLGQTATFDNIYIYFAISTSGILVVMATIVIVGCIYKQGILLLKA